MKIAISSTVEILRANELISENAHITFENSRKRESTQAHFPLTAQVMIATCNVASRKLLCRFIIE